MLVLLIERFLGENLGNNDTTPARYLAHRANVLEGPTISENDIL